MTFPNNSVSSASGWNKQNIYLYLSLSIYLPPSLSSRFFHPFPKQRACSQTSAFQAIKFVKTSLISILIVQDSDCSFDIRVVLELKVNQNQ